MRASSWLAGVVLFAVILVSGCARRHAGTAGGGVEVGADTPAAVSSSILRVGDMVTVTFWDLPAAIPEIKARIPTDGMLSLNYNVRVQAAGRTVPELERDIRAAFVPRFYRQMTAIVRAEDRAFYVGGEVRNPSRFPLLGEVTVLRAIETAGSFTDFANRNRIELRRENGETVMLSEKEIRRNPALDLPVTANDHIRVRRRVVF